MPKSSELPAAGVCVVVVVADGSRLLGGKGSVSRDSNGAPLLIVL